jgi:hypothetical protein
VRSKAGEIRVGQRSSVAISKELDQAFDAAFVCDLCALTAQRAIEIAPTLAQLVNRAGLASGRVRPFLHCFIRTPNFVGIFLGSQFAFRSVSKSALLSSLIVVRDAHEPAASGFAIPNAYYPTPFLNSATRARARAETDPDLEF